MHHLLINSLKQLGKLFQISFFLLKQYSKIFYDYNSVKGFFTNLYFEVLNSTSTNQNKLIPQKKLNQIFSNIDTVHIHTYANYASLFLDRYNPNTPYLLSPKELFSISAIVKYKSPKCIFEIGTYKGWTTANLIKNSSLDCQISTLDIFQNDPNDKEIKKLLPQPNV